MNSHTMTIAGLDAHQLREKKRYERTQLAMAKEKKEEETAEKKRDEDRKKNNSQTNTIHEAVTKGHLTEGGIETIVMRSIKKSDIEGQEKEATLRSQVDIERRRKNAAKHALRKSEKENKELKAALAANRSIMSRRRNSRKNKSKASTKSKYTTAPNPAHGKNARARSKINSLNVNGFGKTVDRFPATEAPQVEAPEVQAPEIVATEIVAPQVEAPEVVVETPVVETPVAETPVVVEDTQVDAPVAQESANGADAEEAVVEDSSGSAGDAITLATEPEIVALQVEAPEVVVETPVAETPVVVEVEKGAAGGSANTATTAVVSATETKGEGDGDAITLATETEEKNDEAVDVSGSI